MDLDPPDFAQKFVSYNKYLFVDMHKGILLAIFMFTLIIVCAFRNMLEVERLLVWLFIVSFILFMSKVIRTPKLYSLWNIRPPNQKARR